MDIPFEDSEALEKFCMPFIKGEKQPETAVELMASRYVAYTLAEVDYIIETHEPDTRSRTDRDATREWAEGSVWEGLHILNTEGGGPDDDTGTVEFVARFHAGGRDQAHHELSSFKKVDGRWYFVDGKQMGNKPVKREAPKVGRNDPCHCGSGKKFKKCCGKAA